MLTKSETIFHVLNTTANARLVYFWDSPDEDVPARTLCLDRPRWEEMGSPETITVTIEPGDRLNDD